MDTSTPAAVAATTERPAPHIWHSINGLELDLSADGRLDIGANDASADGAIHLTPRAALGLLMFFQFPGVADLITQADAAEQARKEAATQAEIILSRKRDAELAAERAAKTEQGDQPA